MIRAKGISDIGVKRTINQDAFFYKIIKVHEQYVGLFAVADGVGGLEMGEYASKIAIQGIERWWNLQLPKCYGKIEKVIKSLVKRIEDINDNITLYSIKNNCNMATTLSILLIYKERHYVLHVGDSRIYHINNTAKQLTTDHKGQDMKTKRMMLTEYLGGGRKQFNYQYYSAETKDNDYFVIGSDGAFNRIKNSDMLKTIDDLTIGKYRLDEGCLQLINKVKMRGETDNITMMIVNNQTKEEVRANGVVEQFKRKYNF